MSFLLDTNVVSEWTKARPNRGVVAWLATAAEDEVFLSVITLAELQYGVETLAAGRRRRALEKWLKEELTARFESRLLGIDANVAETWGKIVARGAAHGRPIGAMDALIAATAVVHNLALVTRNVLDFDAVPVTINPWTAD